MTSKKRNVDSQALARSMGERIKDTIKDGQNLQEIPNIIMDVLKSHGVELPENVAKAIREYQFKK